jgi:hypothetical protein
MKEPHKQQTSHHLEKDIWIIFFVSTAVADGVHHTPPSWLIIIEKLRLIHR